MTLQPIAEMRATHISWRCCIRTARLIGDGRIHHVRGRPWCDGSCRKPVRCGNVRARRITWRSAAVRWSAVRGPAIARLRILHTRSRGRRCGHARTGGVRRRRVRTTSGMVAVLPESDRQSGRGGEKEKSSTAREHRRAEDTAGFGRTPSVGRASVSCCVPRHGRSSFFSFSTHEHFS
jgi:hypothetical protein